MSENHSLFNKSLNRRDFIKIGATAGLSTALFKPALSGVRINQQRLTTPASSTLFSAKPINPVRIGYVGCGSQGTSHIRNLLRIEGVIIKAVCDIVPERTERAQQLVERAGQPKPEGYSRGDTDFLRLIDEQDIDLVYTATPWEWHVPVCVAAMKNDKHAATEVPTTVHLDECWELVETAEKTKKHCIMMENCCYDRTELLELNMVRKELFGELLYSETGYLHDLRGVKFDENYEGRWRRKFSSTNEGNPYPTHGLMPAMQCFNITRGNNFEYLISMSSPSRGLQLWQQEKLAPDDPRRNEKYIQGDINCSLIKTYNGAMMQVIHNCNSPRPYSRIKLIQGTKGIVQEFNNGTPLVSIEGRSNDNWEPLENYRAEFEHPLRKAMEQQAQGAGHGGMDYIEDYRLIKCLQNGVPLDMDVYEAATISAVAELSDQSIKAKGKPQDYPDFTRGAWKNRPPLPIIEG